jgi:hypothetical protein
LTANRPILSENSGKSAGSWPMHATTARIENLPQAGRVLRIRYNRRGEMEDLPWYPFISPRSLIYVPRHVFSDIKARAIMTSLPPKPLHNFFPLRFSPPSVSQSERQSMIEVASYLRAERRNFEPGHETEDWAAAEAEVDQRLWQARKLAGGMG